MIIWFEKIIPRMTPNIPPVIPRSNPSKRKKIITSELFIPTAFIVPISFFLSFIEMNIVVIIPIAPTNNAIMPASPKNCKTGRNIAIVCSFWST